MTEKEETTEKEAEIGISLILTKNVELIDLAVSRGAFTGSEIGIVAQLRALNLALNEKLKTEG